MPKHWSLWFLSQSHQSHKNCHRIFMKITWICQHLIGGYNCFWKDHHQRYITQSSLTFLSNCLKRARGWWSIAEVFRLSSGGVEVLHHQGWLWALFEEEWDADEAVVEDFSKTHKAAKTYLKAPFLQNNLHKGSVISIPNEFTWVIWPASHVFQCKILF